MPSKQTNHKKLGALEELTVIESIRKNLGHEFIDCGYKIMTKYLQR